MSFLTKEDIDIIEAAAEGKHVPQQKSPFDIANDALHGGISGLRLPVEEFVVLPGLSLVSTYAYIMTPFVMAFAPPPNKSAPHPGPWAPLHGAGLSITTEVRLAAGASPLSFDRINTCWFVLALLRLQIAQPFQMPVLADRPFSVVPSDVERANLIPIELQLSRPLFAPPRSAVEGDLEWVAKNISSANELMKDPVFNRAFQTFDRAISITNAGAGIVIAWAAIESLLRPGNQRITERISRALSSYLYPRGPKRDRAFADILSNYKARGGAAHAGRVPEIKQFQMAFQLARSSLIRTIELKKLPIIDELIDEWRNKDS